MKMFEAKYIIPTVVLCLKLEAKLGFFRSSFFKTFIDDIYSKWELISTLLTKLSMKEMQQA